MGSLFHSTTHTLWNSRYLLAEHPVDSRSADQIALRQLPQALAVLPVSEDGGAIENQGFPPDMPAFELGPPHAGTHSLDDQAEFQLGGGADDEGTDVRIQPEASAIGTRYGSTPA